MNPLFDQILALNKDMVVMLRKYYDSCIAIGFTEEQAFNLTLGIQNSFFSQPR